MIFDEFIKYLTPINFKITDSLEMGNLFDYHIHNKPQHELKPCHKTMLDIKS